MSDILFSQKTISHAIARLATQLNLAYHDKDLIIICVLNGAFMFFSDLVKQISIPHRIDFVKISSYGNDQKPGKIEWILKPTLDVKGQDIVVVDDIIDTGNTAKFITSNLRLHNANSVTVCALLSKMENRKWSIFAPCIGFDVQHDPFVFGYGLDLDGRERNLVNIYAK